MSALMTTTEANPRSFSSALKRISSQLLPAVFVLALLGGGWWTVHEISTGTSHEVKVSEPPRADGGAANIVQLPRGKLQAGGFETEAVSLQPVQHSHEIPGRLQYDESKHIELMAPVNGILTDVLVKPGDAVDEGKLLAVISSPEIGRARSEVLKCEAELALVTRKTERATRLARNLKSLFKALDERQGVEAVESAFAESILGSHGQELLTAYSKLLLAAKNIESARPLAESGSIPGKTLRERESAHQVAIADYRSLRDKAAFEAQQAMMQAEIDLADAERRVKIARQQRDSLLGYQEQQVEDETAQGLSRFEVRAPFAGTIETRSYASNERVAQGDSLFVLADTTTLYVAADIRETDWPAVSLQDGQEVQVSIPAIPDRKFTAQVSYVGREVSMETNSVPLIAVIANEHRLLRPGMFVRVVVPVGPTHEALVVRPESILRHDDQDFVFVAVSDDSFQRVDVSTGEITSSWVEVTAGLEAGQKVVTEGAFLLKSELLLEGEEG